VSSAPVTCGILCAPRAERSNGSETDSDAQFLVIHHKIMEILSFVVSVYLLASATFSEGFRTKPYATCSNAKHFLYLNRWSNCYNAKPTGCFLSVFDRRNIDTEIGVRDTASISRNHQTWEKVEKVPLEYKVMQGDLQVPRRFAIPRDDDKWTADPWGIKLGFKAHKIRYNDAYSGHETELDEIKTQRGYDRWKKVEKALIQYKEMEGDLLVPAKFSIPSDDERWPADLWGMKLGSVVNNIRNNNACSDYKDELVQMGFDFERQRRGWKKVEKALLKYRELQGDLLVPFKFAIPSDDDRWPADLWGMKLGSVVHTIRNNNAYADHEAELVQVGFDFERQRRGWKKVEKALLKYKELQGDLLVPQRFAIPSDDDRWPADLWGMKLGSVVHTIRNRNDYSDHKAELVQMGFDFNF
jgi:hypothetical protein